MRHAALCAIVHNAADSLGSGISLATGFYELDLYGDAASSEGKVLQIDLMTGTVLRGTASETTRAALRRIPAVLERMCQNAGGSLTKSASPR